MAPRGGLWLHYTFGAEIWRVTYLFEGHYPRSLIPEALLLDEMAIFGYHYSPWCNLQRMNTYKYPSHYVEKTNRLYVPVLALEFCQIVPLPTKIKQTNVNK